MKRLLLLGVLALAGCSNSITNSQSPHDIIWKNLSNTGIRVVDVTMLYEINGANMTSPVSLCQTAPQGASFRGYQGNTTIKGIACLEQDNSVSIIFEKSLP